MAPQDPLDQALASLRSGRLEEAAATLRALLSREPGHAEALHLAGVVALQSGQPAEAVSLLRAACERAPRVAMAWSNLGVAHAALGDYASALTSHERALRLDPANATAMKNRAVALRELRRFDESLASARQAAMRLPRDAEAHRAVADTLLALGRARESLDHYDRALGLAPADATARHNRGTAHYLLGDAARAATDYRESLAIAPDFARAHGNLSLVLCDLGQFEEAVASAERGVALEPRSADHLTSLAAALDLVGRSEEALVHCDAAIAIDANCARAWSQRALSLGALGRDALALEAHERAAALDPRDAQSLVHRLHLKQRLCDWRGHELLAARIAALAAAGAHCPPFALLHVKATPELQRASAERYSRAALPEPKPRSAAVRRDRIHVAYFSADFREHPVTERIAPILEHHDRSKFTVSAFSFGPAVADAMGERVRKACDRFEDVGALSDAEIAALARKRGVDIAIDLMGYTERARPAIFTHRAAPWQAQYLGFPGTMGTPAMDGLIADAIVVPEAERRHYTETVIALPATYQANDAAGEIVATDRRALGLPERGIVFCCFNDRLKITPETFGAWMRILARVEGSVLWLVDGGERATRNLRESARHAGIDPERLHFARRVPMAEHLARAAAADIALDTQPYSGHATTSDMLRAGVPVVALLGNTFAGRVAASLLGAAGLPQLVSHSWTEYEDLAVALASDPAKLAATRATLAAQRATAPLFDIARFTRDLEAAYEAINGDRPL